MFRQFKTSVWRHHFEHACEMVDAIEYRLR